MYYEGVSSSDNKHRILMAKSRDGRTWTKTGLALDVGEDGAWDCNGVSSPHIIRYVHVVMKNSDFLSCVWMGSTGRPGLGSGDR